MNSTAGRTRLRLPPLKALLAFEAASRNGNFGGGAKELGVTTSAISHQIQQLEDFLGVKLFLRHAGRATLTSAGRVYAEELEQAFEMIGVATELVAPQSQSGHLVIASGPSFAAKWLQPRLPLFLGANPGAKVRLSTLSDCNDLESERFDIAITYGQPAGAQRYVEPLVVEKLQPYCSPDLVQSVGLGSIADLEKATLIHSVNALSWSNYFRRIGHGDLRPANEIWLDRSTIAIDAAVQGMGVVLESELLVAEELASGALVKPFENDDIEVQVTSYYLVKAPGFRGKPQVLAFENWLRDVIPVFHVAFSEAL
ncbi:LysR substrate-binding domain-containing protein [Microbaculum sp. FT89]|uniref:LysR substrate-binding domain-containing protein n=1 Tax=Microbaculum sp. FT89 TaxID=3447298 RepID=UPI003F52975C